MGSLYPPESNHLLDIESLCEPDIRFFVARIEDKIVGCAALRIDASGYGELKRLFVEPWARGKKIGKRLLEARIEQARKDGLFCLYLETGIHQPEVRALLRAAGFEECGPFGEFKADPFSVFMKKVL